MEALPVSGTMSSIVLLAISAFWVQEILAQWFHFRPSLFSHSLSRFPIIGWFLLDLKIYFLLGHRLLVHSLREEGQCYYTCVSFSGSRGRVANVEKSRAPSIIQ